MSTLPEVREADADAETREIYAEIRAASRLGQVNLIWRHLAIDIAVLRWVWGVLGPEYRHDRLHLLAEARAQHLSKTLAASGQFDGHEQPFWPGLDADARALSQAVLAFYTRANAMNLTALQAFVQYARHGRPGPPIEIPDGSCGRTSEPTELTPLPRLPQRSEMPDSVGTRVDALSARHGGVGLGVTPSFYLHLGLEPEALFAADNRLSRFLGSDAFLSGVETLVSGPLSGADNPVVATLCEQAGTPRPDAGRLEPFLAALESFTTTTIPEMLTVCVFLNGSNKTVG